MSASTPPILQGLTEAMRHLSDRQRVVAQNIANSETPGYRSRDLQAPDFSSLVAAHGSTGGPRVSRPRVTVTSGMAALGASAPTGGSVVLDRDVSETKPNGNNVTLEDQLLRIGQMQADFATLTGLYRKQMGLLRSAIGRSGG